MVDEAVKAEDAFNKAFPSEVDFSAMQQLQHDLLGSNFQKYGMQGALVLSGLEPRVAGRTASGPYIYPFVLCEDFNSTAATDGLFLSDVDADGNIHIVAPRLPPNSYCSEQQSEQLAREVLIRIAGTFGSLPRGPQH